MIADVIARELHAKALVVYAPNAAGGDCFIDDLPAEPAAAVGVYGRGGQQAEGGLAYDAPSVQVVVRGATKDPRVPHARARSIYAWLADLHHYVLPDGSFLVSCMADQSDVVRIGPDANGRPQYGLNFTLDVRAPTTHRE